MSGPKGNHQWSVAIEDPRLTLTRDTAMADLRAKAVACVRRRCPDHTGVILEMLGLTEVTW